MKASHSIRPVFDDPNLVSAAGLVPVMRLAESAGLHDLLEDLLSIGSANATAKTTSVIGGMLAGADCIDDLDLLRHGAMGKLFGGVRAPSTLGTFLRTFTHGHVQQLDAVGGRLLAGLAQRTPGLMAGAQDREAMAFIDIDDTVREVHGYAKQGAAYGYTGVRGLNVQVTTISTPLAAPVIARARLRRGNVASATGAGRMLAQSVTTARAAGVAGQIMGRAHSAFYGHAFVGAAIRHRIWFSVTARMDPKVKATIASIRQESWTAIKYPKAIWEEDDTVPGGGYWVSDAEVAEVDFVAFTGRRKSEHVPCRLVVRRVKRLQPAAPDGTEQSTLFATYRHHAFITNSTLSTIEADERRRDHASSSRSSLNSRTMPWPTCPPGPAPRTRPGSRWRSLRSTSPAQPSSRRYGQSQMGHRESQADQHPSPTRRHRPQARPAATHQVALGRARATLHDNATASG